MQDANLNYMYEEFKKEINDNNFITVGIDSKVYRFKIDTRDRNFVGPINLGDYTLNQFVRKQVVEEKQIEKHKEIPMASDTFLKNYFRQRPDVELLYITTF